MPRSRLRGVGGARPSTSHDSRSPSGTFGFDTSLHPRRLGVAGDLHADLDLLLAPPRRDLQRRVVERPVEDDDAGIDLQRLAVGEEGRVQGFDAAVGAQLAVLGRLHLKLAR